MAKAAMIVPDIRPSLATVAKPPSDGELLERLAAMAPGPRARAPLAERLRQLVYQTIAEAKEAGFLPAFRTRHFGSPESGLSALANGARIPAHGLHLPFVWGMPR